MSRIDKAIEKFEAFEKEYEKYKSEDLSESDTRSKVLDSLLLNVLGWDESNLKREGHSDAGFYDYKISIPSFHFVVEAKKNYVEFDLPTKHRFATLKALRKQNDEVINQIRGYLSEEGLQFGVITNGHQFIIAKFINIDGTDWKNNKAVIFKNVEDVNKRFIDFFNLLSCHSILENNGFNLFEEESFEGKTIYSTISNPNKELIRNSLSSNLTPILDSVFGEIFSNDLTSDQKLIKECFVSNDEIIKNKSEIKKLFADLPPRLEEVIPAKNTKNIAAQVSDEIESDVVSIKSDKAPKPIVLIGSKGAGKTTFINYLFSTSISEDLRKSHPVLYLDIRKFTVSDLKDNHTKIYKELLDLLYDNYSELNLHTRKVLIRIYIKEIRRHDEGIWSHMERRSEDYEKTLSEFLQNKYEDIESHFIKISEYLVRERRIRIFAVFDNADQLDIEIQKEAFLFSQSINTKAKCGVILSLREGYYIKWRSKPPFDAYYSNVYHITAPPYGEVIQKRIDYALSEVSQTGKVRGKSDLFLDAEIEVSKQAIVDFFNSAKQTLFTRENSEMLEFLSHTTYPNIREGLRIFKRFLLSGHTQVEQYVVRQNVDPNAPIPIPIHEFVKSIALDNKLIYNSENSIVQNILKPINGNTNHFLKYKLLRYLERHSKSSSQGEKFYLIDSLIEVFGQAGYRTSIILGELDELMSYGLLESQDIRTDTKEMQKLERSDSIAINLKGHYYINNLINRFHYLELVAQDTPIFNNDSFEEISSKYVNPDDKGRRRLDHRMEFVKSFYEYLVKAEQKETVDNDQIEIGVMNNIKNNGLGRDLAKISRIISAGNNR